LLINSIHLFPFAKALQEFENPAAGVAVEAAGVSATIEVDDRHRR